MRIVVVVGTRPEVIKMAPLVHELRLRPQVDCRLVATGQHREMAGQALASFDLSAERDLDVMQESQSLARLTGLLIERLSETVRELRPEVVLAQGDTTTVLAAGLAAYYERVPFGHVEAGLRSHDDEHPWPEEMNRRLSDSLSTWCFAPTEGARRNLLREGIDEARISVTGNTGIDALLWMRNRVERRRPALPSRLADAVDGRRLVLVTGHRRESFGPVFEGLCRAMRTIAAEHEDLQLVYPVHLNPEVRRPVGEILDGQERVLLLDPLPYDQLVWLLSRCHLVLTDSGGIQEEAPALGKPVVVMRETSERPEGVESGNAVVAGTDEASIVASVKELLESDRAYRERARVAFPYGDGRAAARIVDLLLAGRPARTVQPT